MEGQPLVEIWVPTGRIGVVTEGSAKRVVLGVRVVFVEFVNVGKESDGVEMLRAMREGS